MNNSFTKVVIYRYWHISIILLVLTFSITYKSLSYIIEPSSKISLQGWSQILSLAIMLSPLSYLVSNYQKINETKDIKGVNITERKILKNIINSRCKDILLTIILATIISLFINGYIILAQQNSISLKPMSINFFIAIVISYLITCMFWLLSAFLAISELYDYKAQVQNRIDKDSNKSNFDKLIE